MNTSASTTHQNVESGATAQTMQLHLIRPEALYAKRKPVVRPHESCLFEFRCERFHSRPRNAPALDGPVRLVNPAHAPGAAQTFAQAPGAGSSRTGPHPYEFVYQASDMSLCGRARLAHVDWELNMAPHTDLRKRKAEEMPPGQPDSKRTRVEPVQEKAVKAEPAHTDASQNEPLAPITAAGPSSSLSELAPALQSMQAWQSVDHVAHAFMPVQQASGVQAPAQTSADMTLQDGINDALLYMLSDLLSHGLALVGASEREVTLKTQNAVQGNEEQFVLHIRWETLSATSGPAALTETALHYLAVHGRLKAMDFLIAHGAAVPAQYASDATLLRHAVLHGCIHLLQALIWLGADISRQDAQGRCLLHDAVDAGRADVVDLLCIPALVDQLDSDSNTPLLLAVREEKGLDICAALLKGGANPDYKDGDGHTALTRAIEQNSNMVVAMLLRAGAEPDLADDSGNTPLHLACANGNEEAVMLLLGRNCAVDLQNRLGRTALDIATENGMEEDTHELLRSCMQEAAWRRRGVPGAAGSESAAS
jgi:ankyrin repeat protein